MGWAHGRLTNRYAVLNCFNAVIKRCHQMATEPLAKAIKACK